jgi:hypothetical protein
MNLFVAATGNGFIAYFRKGDHLSGFAAAALMDIK